jgi:hypothetical protein
MFIVKSGDMLATVNNTTADLHQDFVNDDVDCCKLKDIMNEELQVYLLNT